VHLKLERYADSRAQVARATTGMSKAIPATPIAKEPTLAPAQIIMSPPTARS
jgi:hypothetical protein